MARQSKIAFESSPRYLLSSDRIPHAILCVVPWVKLLAILRNPVDRVESHYKYLDQSRRRNEQPMVDWQTWINDDIRLLNEAGVFNATTQQDEWVAWKWYNRRPNSNLIVGRGLYVIQIEQYLDAMDQVGKPREDLFVMQSETFRRHPQREYDKLLQFLQLPPHTLKNTTEEHVTSNQSLPMPPSIRKQLRELYAPYNQRLYQLLNWEPIWDP